MLEHYFTCPYCWQTVSMLVDNTISNQEYIEDCEVCCNPIQIFAKFLDAELIDFQADSIEQ